jgi:hypothetical protein
MSGTLFKPTRNVEADTACFPIAGRGIINSVTLDMKYPLPKISSLAAPTAATVMVALIIAGFVLLKDYRPFGRVQQMPALRNIGLRLEDAELAGRSNGHKAWRFRAKVVEVSQDRSNTTFINLDKGIVYDRDQPALHLRASTLTYRSFSRDIVGQGRIRVTANGNISIATESLSWSQSRRKLVCPGTVSIEMGTGKGSAGSLEADLANDSLLLRKVNLRLPADEELVRTR